MRDASLRACQRILATHGQQGWVAITREFGRTFRLNGIVVTCEPEAVRALLMERPHAERRPPIHRLMAALPGADGILFKDGEPWLTRTRAVMPVFQQRNIDACSTITYETTLAHLARWQAAPGSLELAGAVQQLGVATLLRIGYGLDPADPAAVRLGQALVAYKQLTMRPRRRDRLDELGLLPERLFDLPWILAGIVQMWLRTRDVEQALREVMASRDAAGERPDWIRQLGAAGFDVRQLAVEVNHLYGAFNAVDYAAAAALYELARRPDLAHTIREETRAVAADGRPPARDDLLRMPVTRACILETLRRYPVTMAVIRQTGTPLNIAGDAVPAGAQVMILLHALHHHPDFWNDADVFEPGRWLESQLPAVPYSYVPFLDGSRKCIGRAMAEMHLLIVITTVLRRFDVAVDGEAVVPPFIIPRFATPLPFRLVPAPTA